MELFFVRVNPITMIAPYNARQRRSLNDCIHNVFRTVWILALSADFNNVGLILSSNLRDYIKKLI